MEDAKTVSGTGSLKARRLQSPERQDVNALTGCRWSFKFLPLRFMFGLFSATLILFATSPPSQLEQALPFLNNQDDSQQR